MEISDEAVHFVRTELSKSFNNHRIIIAPSKVEVYSAKTKDFLKKPSDVKWSLVGSGILAVVYDTKENSDRLQLCLTSPKTANIIWQENIVPFTTIDSPHPTFHTLTSTRNYQERTGILYQNKAVARLVFQVMSMFTSQTRSQSSKKVLRSQSFCVAPRPKATPGARDVKNTLEICTIALSKVHVQRVFSTSSSSPKVSGPMTASICVQRPPQRMTFTPERKLSSPPAIIKRRGTVPLSLLTTDLCTTEL
ncbi:uncharacterized protein LOC116298599 [Actinia tenebrosa]|uniref:Uncharacterized protein LOC116298599 n=1 Tax=Actinia tenebrosa TaxID=6105 RepID=A0A6P8IBQ6_ACTTE|nr:uncharacterized protein LOC116298599 [Actinia tenebrosa]XP_031562978.1 uncharacterized protein LOC116298599 [Actinia tenebrosa]